MKAKISILAVRERVARIKAMQADTEAAHYEEDKLHQDVLMHIARHGDTVSAIFAREALETLKLDFAR